MDGFYFIQDDKEIYMDGKVEVPEGAKIIYKDSGVPQSFLDELASETINDIEEDIFNPDQEIKDWDS